METVDKKVELTEAESDSLEVLYLKIQNLEQTASLLKEKMEHKVGDILKSKKIKTTPMNIRIDFQNKVLTYEEAVVGEGDK